MISLRFDVLLGQIILPNPKKVPETGVFWLYGTGSISTLTDSLSASTSANFAARIRATELLSFFVSYNKGAGLTRADLDSFKFQSLFFPEHSSSAFSGNATFLLPWVFQSDSLHVHNQFGVFMDYSAQIYNLKKNDLSLEFTTDTYQPGLRYIASYFQLDDIKVRFMLTASWYLMHVNSRGIDNFRTAFADSTLPDTYVGINWQAAIQLNDLTIAYSFRNIRATGIGDRFIKGVEGSAKTITFTVTGNVIGQ